MIFKSICRLILTVLISLLLGFGVFDYLQNNGTNECSMTYMFHSPDLIPVELPLHVKTKFLNYKLYLYCEGFECGQYEKLKFTQPGHIPVLFVTGNADSHKQVRSVASVGLDKTRNSKRKNIHFQYFTISFNEELSALYGPLLDMQTEFTKHCIEHILTLFELVQPELKRPKSVLLIGNSMGGIVSRAIFVSNKNDEFSGKILVHTIITQATPHIRPVLNVDSSISAYYERVDQFWLNKSQSNLDNVVLASLYGGTRDILVRAGLANINDWKSRTPAGIVSGYTVSMPHVWRSIDHRCMSWCRELVLAVNRALFDLVDPVTEQIVEDKQTRLQVLKHYFERDIPSNKHTLSYLKNQTATIETINFEFNDFNSKKKTIIIHLDKFLDPAVHDSLFIYTNLNKENTFVLCDAFEDLNEDEFKCRNHMDLSREYGRSMPPLFEGAARKLNTLRTINVNDFKRLISKNKFSYLLVNLPVRVRKPNARQLIAYFDWYLKKDRIQQLHTPNFVGLQQNELIKVDSAVTFRRFYLPQFESVLQAFRLNKIDTASHSCDAYLLKQFQAKKTTDQRPLSASTLMIHFYEATSIQQATQMNEHVTHSQAFQGRDQNLKLKLTANRNEHVPYIELINVKLEHLLHYTSMEEDEEALFRSCKSDHVVEVKVDYEAVLGQIVRFMLPLTPAFLIAILQFYDFLILRTRQDDKPVENSFFILHMFQSQFEKHFLFSLVLNIMIFIFIAQTELLQQGVLFLPKNDMGLLKAGGVYHTAMGFILYWCSYGIISVATFFLSIIFNVISFLLHNVFFRFLGFLKYNFVQKQMSFLHLIITVACGVLASALTHCSLFYGEMLRLASINPIYLLPTQSASNHLKFCAHQTRLLFIYLMLILNLPSLIVWTKSLQNNELRPLNTMVIDNGSNIAAITLVIYMINKIKRAVRCDFFVLNNNLLSWAIMVNIILTIGYSLVNLYRLQYFILMHLFLMSFNSIEPIVTDLNKLKVE